MIHDFSPCYGVHYYYHRLLHYRERYAFQKQEPGNQHDLCTCVLLHRILWLKSSCYTIKILSCLLPSSWYTCFCCSFNIIFGRHEGTLSLSWSTSTILALCVLEDISNSFGLSQVLSYTASEEPGIFSSPQGTQETMSFLHCLLLRSTESHFIRIESKTIYLGKWHDSRWVESESIVRFQQKVTVFTCTHTHTDYLEDITNSCRLCKITALSGLKGEKQINSGLYIWKPLILCFRQLKSHIPRTRNRKAN